MSFGPFIVVVIFLPSNWFLGTSRRWVKEFLTTWQHSERRFWMFVALAKCDDGRRNCVYIGSWKMSILWWLGCQPWCHSCFVFEYTVYIDYRNSLFNLFISIFGGLPFWDTFIGVHISVVFIQSIAQTSPLNSRLPMTSKVATCVPSTPSSHRPGARWIGWLPWPNAIGWLRCLGWNYLPDVGWWLV